MVYGARKEWENAPNRQIMLYGMTGLGKTHVSKTLRAENWFHYSIDYRIGTYYMYREITDNLKAEAMKNPFLRELLRSDSIYIESNMEFDNLAPLSTYLGKPGNPDLGGIPIAEYRRRQAIHRRAEILSLKETWRFIERARSVYGYPHFVCDSGGSICEVVDVDDPGDEIMAGLSEYLLPVWIKGGPDHREKLVERFKRAPKPMYYHPGFLDRAWAGYVEEKGLGEAMVDPSDFIVWAYGKAIDHRLPRYEKMARKWGVTVDANDVAEIRSEADLVEVVGQAIDSRGGG